MSLEELLHLNEPLPWVTNPAIILWNRTLQKFNRISFSNYLRGDADGKKDHAFVYQQMAKFIELIRPIAGKHDMADWLLSTGIEHAKTTSDLIIALSMNNFGPSGIGAHMLGNLFDGYNLNSTYRDLAKQLGYKRDVAWSWIRGDTMYLLALICELMSLGKYAIMVADRSQAVEERLIDVAHYAEEFDTWNVGIEFDIRTTSKYPQVKDSDATFISAAYVLKKRGYNPHGNNFVMRAYVLIREKVSEWCTTLSFESSRCVYLIGKEISNVKRGNVDFTKENQSIKDAGSHLTQPVIRCYRYYVKCVAETRAATDAWLIISRRMGLCKDLHRLIGQWVWNTRFLFSEAI